MNKITNKDFPIFKGVLVGKEKGLYYITYQETQGDKVINSKTYEEPYNNYHGAFTRAKIMMDDLELRNAE